MINMILDKSGVKFFSTWGEITFFLRIKVLWAQGHLINNGEHGGMGRTILET